MGWDFQLALFPQKIYRDKAKKSGTAVFLASKIGAQLESMPFPSPPHSGGVLPFLCLAS